MIFIDEIGTMQDEATGLPVAGYHVNASQPVTGWEAWRVFPATPQRLIAGCLTTAAYKFLDAADFNVARSACSEELVQ